MSDVVLLDNVTFSYDHIPALNQISLRVEEKDFVVVVGPNGGGKTTLLEIILGFLQPDEGAVRIFGKKPSEVNHRIGYVPQYSEFERDFPLSALDVTLSGLIKKTSFLPWYSKEEKQKAYKILEKVGILDYAHKKIGNLSGGQKQRVLIARALVSNPEILLLDEPTASIDQKVERHIYEFLAELNQEITIILVTHDMAFVSRYAKKFVCLNRKISVNQVDNLNIREIGGLYNTPGGIISHHCEL